MGWHDDKPVQAPLVPPAVVIPRGLQTAPVVPPEKPAGKFTLSDQSRAKLKGVHPDLVKVVERAIQLSPVDFRVDCGVRTHAEQLALYAKGRSAPGPKVTWTLNSRHKVQPDGYGHAVDLLPLPIDWNKLEPFNQVAAAMMQAAQELGVMITWGANWDGDGKPREKGESDSPHFELSK
jgi:peptidoglycan L-alanyl-D-glutamate endopeptidase CwlK